VSAGDAGQGLLTTVLSVGVVLALLLLAVHVAAHLHATSAVRALAYDAVRDVAGADVDHDDAHDVARAAAEATERLTTALGGAASRLRELRWDLHRATEVIVLHLEVAGTGGVIGRPVSATVRARVEVVR
jgi:hypothetical protein